MTVERNKNLRLLGSAWRPWPRKHLDFESKKKQELAHIMNISKYIQMLDLDQIFAHVDTLWFFYVFLLQVQFNCHELDVRTMTRHDHASCLVAECMLNAIQIYSIYIPLNAIKIHQITITSPYYSIYYVANQWYGQFYILPFIKFILYYITIIYISIYTIYTISP